MSRSPMIFREQWSRLVEQLYRASWACSREQQADGVEFCISRSGGFVCSPPCLLLAGGTAIHSARPFQERLGADGARAFWVGSALLGVV
jgi:hypothetical protein